MKGGDRLRDLGWNVLANVISGGILVLLGIMFGFISADPTQVAFAVIGLVPLIGIAVLPVAQARGWLDRRPFKWVVGSVGLVAIVCSLSFRPFGPLKRPSGSLELVLNYSVTLASVGLVLFGAYGLWRWWQAPFDDHAFRKPSLLLALVGGSLLTEFSVLYIL